MNLFHKVCGCNVGNSNSPDICFIQLAVACHEDCTNISDFGVWMQKLKELKVKFTKVQV